MLFIKSMHLINLHFWTYLKTRVHAKAVLTSLNTAFLPISGHVLSRKANLYAYNHNHRTAALCPEFWVIFGHFEKEIVFLKA